MSLKVVNPINIIPSLFSLWLFITSCQLVGKAKTLLYVKSILFTWLLSLIIVVACIFSIFVKDREKLLLNVSFITFVCIVKFCMILFLIAVLKEDEDVYKEIIPLLLTIASNLLICIFYFKFTFGEMLNSFDFNNKKSQ